MGLDVYDCDSGTLEIQVWGKGGKERAAYAEEGSDRALNGWLRLRGAAARLLVLPANKGGRGFTSGARDACAGVKLQHFYTGPQSPIPGAWEPASATAP